MYDIIMKGRLHTYPLNASDLSNLLSYYGLLTREPFSYRVVWVDIVPKPVDKGTIPSQTTL
jgi:hypothetical protein